MKVVDEAARGDGCEVDEVTAEVWPTEFGSDGCVGYQQERPDQNERPAGLECPVGGAVCTLRIDPVERVRGPDSREEIAKGEMLEEIRSDREFLLTCESAC